MSDTIKATTINTDGDVTTSEFENSDSHFVTGTTVEPIAETDEFVNNDNEKEFRLLNLKAKLNDINAVIDNINREQKKVLGDNEELDPLDTVLKKYTEEELKEMTSSQINEILVDEEGNSIEFAFEFEDEDKMNQFKKDFLVLRRQSLTSFETFDAEIAKINEEIKESQEEFDRLVATVGNVSNLIRSKIEERISTAEEGRKDLYVKMLKSFDNGMNLDNLKEYCASYKGRKIIGDYHDNKKSQYLYRTYMKIIESLDIKTNLTSFTGLENKFLTVDYHQRENIFLFAMIHFIASWNNRGYDKTDGLFITQFTVNLKNLFYDKFDNPEDKETFINNINEVIKIIG